MTIIRDNVLITWQHLLKGLLTIVLLNIFLLSTVQAQEINSKVASVKQQPWQDMIQTQPVYKGVFNQNLRQAVLNKLTLPKISAEDLEDKTKLLALLQPRLQELDKELSKYVRVSERVSRFEQLKRLMPALYNINERNLIEGLLKKQGVSVPRMRNSRLVRFIDKRISLLANGLIFNMKALVRERRDYEPELLRAMASKGIRFSALPPDFILDYSLVEKTSEKEGQWLFDAHISLLGKYEIPIVEVSENISENATSLEQAQSKSVDLLASKVVEKLKEYLVKRT
ncbi:hypothetical protein [Thiomicrorhabdus sp. Milos-T2]|uniref:hypothetical protein n=1 Tax=Thiomicrorhabdus sp. Milos-T2 TaxID=90814 RepID=UPI00131A260C|nr:hypothetical protein [Thiomicrorhabdus sp. Milos-T2]